MRRIDVGAVVCLMALMCVLAVQAQTQPAENGLGEAAVQAAATAPVLCKETATRQLTHLSLSSEWHFTRSLT
jgi:hypothetical protein